MNVLVGPVLFADVGRAAGGSARGRPDDDANGTSSVQPEAPFAGSATTEATWRGGPWDGVTMTVVAGERFFLLYGDTQAQDDETTRPVPPGQRGAPPGRLCPIVPGPHGGLIIDWDAGINR
jgi:hypothetical protein